MAISISWNGTTYSFPSAGAHGYAALLTALLQSFASNAATRSTSGVGVIQFGCWDTIADTATRYLWPGFSKTDNTTSQVTMRVPAAGKISNLYVRAYSEASGGTTTLTVNKNGVPQTLSVVLPSVAGVSGADTTHSFTVAAGDRLSVSVVHGVGISAGAAGLVATLAFTAA